AAEILASRRERSSSASLSSPATGKISASSIASRSLVSRTNRTPVRSHRTTGKPKKSLVGQGFPNKPARQPNDADGWKYSGAPHIAHGPCAGLALDTSG